MKFSPRSRQMFVIWTVFGLTAVRTASAGTFTINFDNLPTLGPTTQSQSLSDANGGSSTIDGVTFANNFSVVGNEYRVGGAAPNPTFGVPHSGNYFITNGNTPNDDLIITTTSVLTEAWFGYIEYYGYGGGATSITVTAFGVGGDLGFETINLPDTFPYTGNLPFPDDGIGNGLADPMVKLDTSSFLGLLGITGYRISRFDSEPLNGNWAADDFTFVTASTVPEPSTLTAIGIGLITLGYSRRRNLIR